MQPLKWPVDWSKLSPWQRVMKDTPLVGVRDRVYKEIVAQMEQRTADLSEFWNKFTWKELEIKQRISKILIEELGWPTSHFLPSDPFEIILWDGKGELGTVAAIDRIEKELGLIKRSEPEWKELATRTFGDVVQKIAAELAHKKSG
jgi:hypothetical protein